MTPLRVSVVIPAINEAAVIERAVKSVGDEAIETIVVDGGSRDETAELASRAGAQVVHSPAGRARQQNAGATAASGDVLLFLHADNYLSETAVAQVIGLFADRPGACWGAMRQRILDPAATFRVLEWGNALRVRLRQLPFGDQAIFIRRDVFEQVGGFPDQPLMEDVLLASQLRRRWRPCLIDGPVYVDARRWRQRGPWRQTLLNWHLQWLHARGTSPAELAGRYRRHDAPPVGRSG